MNDPARGEGKRRRRAWPFVALVAVLVVALAVVFVVPQLVDVERYRGRIEAAIEDATGWEASLGDIRFSVLRGLVVAVDDVELRPEPSDGTAVRVAVVEVGARLRPLLSGRLVVHRVELVAPDASLVRTGDAWPLPVPRTTSGPAEAPAGEGLAVSVERIVVRDGTIVLEDRTASPPRRVRLEDLSLELRPAADALSGDARLAAGGRLAWSGSTAAPMSLGVDLDDVSTEALREWLGPGLVGEGGLLSGRIDVAGPGEVTGTMRGTSLTLLAGEKPLERVDAAFRIESDGERWRLASLEATDGAATLTGSGELAPSLDLTLELPDSPLEAALGAARGAFPVPLDVEPPGRARATMRVRQPPDEPLSYSARGVLSAARVRTAELLPPAEDVRASFELSPAGTLDVRIDEGSLGGGPLRGTARIAPVVPPGRLAFDGALSGAALGALLAGFIEEAPRKISGPADVAARVEMDLATGTMDLGALSGSLDVAARDVTLPGWDLEAILRERLRERLGKLGELVDAAARLDPRIAQKLGRGAQEGQAAAESAARRVLDALQVDLSLSGSPWTMKRLALRAGDLTAQGSGTFDPSSGAVDLSVTARLSAAATAKLVGERKELRRLVGPSGELAVPMRLSGSTVAPEVKVDLRGLASGLVAGEPAAGAGLGQEARTSLQEEAGAAKEELGQDVKQKAEEKLEERARGVLEGLLGKKKRERPAPPPEEAAPAPPPEAGGSEEEPAPEQPTDEPPARH